MLDDCLPDAPEILTDIDLSDVQIEIMVGSIRIRITLIDKLRDESITFVTSIYEFSSMLKRLGVISSESENSDSPSHSQRNITKS